jgi:predicted HTH transcriptional regulator
VKSARSGDTGLNGPPASKQREVREGILNAVSYGAAASVFNLLQEVASKATIEREASKLIKKGKLKRNGTGPSNTTWVLAAEPQQAGFNSERSWEAIT